MPSLRILNISFDIELPYEPGQTITSSEAHELNKLRTERIGEQARTIIRQRRAAQQPDPSPEELSELARTFQFTLTDWAPPSDPQELEARKIARSIVEAQLARSGEKPTAEQFARLVSVTARTNAVRTEAARRTLETQRVAQAALLTDVEDTTDII